MTQSATPFQERIISIDRRRVGDILPNERNPKQPTHLKQERLTAVLSQFGKAGVLLTYHDEQGVERFFDGNTRRGIDPDDVWYIAQTDLSQKEVDDLVMLYDPLAEPDWEPELLKILAGETAVEGGVLGDMLAEILEELGAGLEWNTIPSLDELGDKYGDPQERDFWPFIRVQVSPETYQLWQSFMNQQEGEDEAVKMANILEAVDATLFSNMAS